MTLAIAVAANIVLIAGLVALLSYAMTRPTLLQPHAGEPQPRPHRRPVHRERSVREAPRTRRAAVSARA